MTDRTPGPRYAWYVAFVLMVATVSGMVDRYIMSLLVIPIEHDLAIGDAQMSYLIGASFYVLFSILGVPIGRLADRSSRRNIMAVGVALWSLFTMLCSTAHSYRALLGYRVGVGIGEATLIAPSISLLADYFPREKLGRCGALFASGVLFGSGMAYFLGAWIVGLVPSQGVLAFPILSSMRPWQAVFFIVGLPGLAISLLLLTVREPRRQASGAAQVPWRVVLAYVSANRRAFLLQTLAFTASSTVNNGLAAWVAPFFVRTYDWSISDAGKVQGILTMSLGVLAVVAGGWLASRDGRRGATDGPLRVGMIGAAGMLVAATAFPLMPTASLAVACLAVVNVFAALPWGAAQGAAAEIIPASLRAQGVALYFLIFNLVSFSLGPSSVAWLTEYVFHDEHAVRYSLAIVNVIGMTTALVLFAVSRPAYRRIVAQREEILASLSS